MVPTTPEPQVHYRRPQVSWGLLSLTVGALVLIGAALLAISLAGQRPAEFAPISSPDGVVQRFFDATYRGDYASAYAMLSETTRRDRSLAEFQERLRYERESEMRVDAVAIHNGTATVTITVTHFDPGGIFGGSEWNSQYDILLERDGDTWRIVGEPYG